MKKGFLMLFIGIIVSSCLHDEEEISVLEGSYKLPSTLYVGKVQMFTSKGVVTDEAKIKEFLTRKPKLDLPDNTAYFSFDASSVPIGDGNYLDITFTSNKAAVHTNLMLGEISIDSPYNADIFKISNLIVVSKNVSGLNVPISTDRFISDFFETDKITKIKTESHGVKPYPTYQPGRINLALIEQNGEIILPYFTYFHGSYTNRTYYAKSSYNILNSDYLTHLPASDTIVVQEGWAIMQKKQQTQETITP